MAVELCKVSLWLEALEPGKPLSFLDAHIKCGNSLIGSTPELVSAGIPDSAFEPLDGDDGRTARALRDRNAQERAGQLGFTDIGMDVDVTGLATLWTQLETMDESSVEQVKDKEREYRRLLESPLARQQRRAADAWCAAFFTLKAPGAPSITSASMRAIWMTDSPATTAMDQVTSDALVGVGTFHWPLEFPDVTVRGGFDVVLGNPPWEALSPDAKEFFAVYDPGVRNVDPREQKGIIDGLLRDPVIQAAWDAYCWRLYRLANFLRKSGRYKLFAPGNLGKGDFNVYRIFVELALQLTREGGRAAQIVPDGFYLGANASAIRRELIDRWRWDLLLGFQNAHEIWFKDIYYRMKFCIYTARKGGQTETTWVAFGIKTIEDLRRARNGGGAALSTRLLRELSPETFAVPDVSDIRGLSLVERISNRWPGFGLPRDGWPQRDYMREFDMGNDRDRFNDLDGYPLFEGRMVGQFDHRAKAYITGRGRTAVWHDLPFGDADKEVVPQWRVRSEDVPGRVRPRLLRYRLGFCDVASSTNERTLVAAMLPPGVVAGDKVPTIVLDGGTAADYMLCLAAANSLVVDFVARRKVSLKMSYTILDGLPIPRRALRDDGPTREIVDLAARLTCVSADTLNLWDELAAAGWVPERSPSEIPGLMDEPARLGARARLDAVVAVHLFGLEATDMAIILSDFKQLANREQRVFGEFRTNWLVLAAMEHEQSRAGHTPVPPESYIEGAAPERVTEATIWTALSRDDREPRS